MAYKTQYRMVALEPEGILYVEQGEARMWLGIVRDANGRAAFISTIADNEDTAKIQLMKGGEVLSMLTLEELILAHLDNGLPSPDRIL